MFGVGVGCGVLVVAACACLMCLCWACVCVCACRVVAGVCWRLWSCWLVCGGSEGIDTAEPVSMSRALDHVVLRLSFGGRPCHACCFGRAVYMGNVGLQAQP